MLKVFSASLFGHYGASGFVVVAAQDRAEAWKLTQTAFYGDINCDESDLLELDGVAATGESRTLVSQINPT